MYTNIIDELINTILNEFYNLYNKKIIQLASNIHFVKMYNEILTIITKFINHIENKKLLDVVHLEENNYIEFINFIKSYCMLYIYIGIAYYYKGSIDDYTINIIECATHKDNISAELTHIYTSRFNSNIINYFNIIKNIISLQKIKDFTKIKSILSNDLIKYDSTINFFNELSEEYITTYFLTDDNFNNIIKTIIYKFIYLKENKHDINKILQQKYIESTEYKYIDIIITRNNQLVDINFIEKFLTNNQLSLSLATEIVEYINDIFESKDLANNKIQDFISYLFTNKIIIPITEEYLRFHKDTEKYISSTIVDGTNIKQRDATKLLYIITKMNNITNYYSPLLTTNPKLKLTIKNLFYKQYEDRLCVLYNDDEEIRIINKMQLVDSKQDYELLIELEKLRKYAYNNFKHFSKDGIKINSMQLINAIRYSNINVNNKLKTLIETKILNDFNEAHCVGIAFNPHKYPLYCSFKTYLTDIRKISQSENGFLAFIKLIESNINILESKKHPKINFKKIFPIYYWLFDNTKDILQTEKYVNYNVNDIQNNIKLMINEIFNVYIKSLENYIIKSIEKIKSFTFEDLEQLLNKYDKQLFSLFPEIKNKISELIIIKKIPQIQVIPDPNESIEALQIKKEDIILLPTIVKSDINNKHIPLRKKLNNDIDDTIEGAPEKSYLCYHYIKWKNILSLNKNSDEFAQSIFDFSKQYAKINNQGLYICKSCNNILDIDKFEFTGTYIEELDTFLTTSIAVNQELITITKYANYPYIIKNIDKNIERISYITDITTYIGNDNIIKLRRRLMIKDIIDFILVHTKSLKNNIKNKEEYNKKYGIKSELTQLYSFELKDDIFLIKSSDVEQYNIIKYNNIIIYILLFILLELTFSQLLFLKYDTMFNYLYFNKTLNIIFNNINIQISQVECIPINTMPLFCYIIYYFSGLIVLNKIWLYDDSHVPQKDKLSFMISQQKIIIHTFIDLFNSIFNAETSIETTYIYDLLYNKIYNKFSTIYKKNELIEQIINNQSKYVNINSNKHIHLSKTKIELVNIKQEYTPLYANIIYCLPSSTIYDKKQKKISTNIINQKTNCSSGQFHKWIIKDDKIICSLCNQYIDQHESINTYELKQLEILKYNYLTKLTQKYCIDGYFHEFNNTLTCIKCKKNPLIYKFTSDELLTLENNLQTSIKKQYMEHINLIDKKKQQYIIKTTQITQFIQQLTTKFNEANALYGSFELYINNFITKIQNVIGDTYLNIPLLHNNIIIIYDHNGYKLNKPINKSLNDDFFTFVKKHSFYKKDIIYCKLNNIYMFYDIVTLQFIGHSENNTEFHITNLNISITINMSIKDYILLLGYEDRYINSHNYYNSNTKNNNYDIISTILLHRINNLKQIIYIIQTIIISIKNKKKMPTDNTSYHITNIIKKYNAKISNITTEADGHILFFKNIKYIINNLHLDYNFKDNKIEFNNEYVNTQDINNLYNTDILIIFYIIYYFDKLIDNNQSVHTEILNLILDIIIYIFNLFLIDTTNYDIRKFKYIIYNEPSYMHESLKIVGYYQELLAQAEIDDEVQNEQAYENEEIMNAFDIDDYEYNEDFDEAAENFGEGTI